jgi:hypothetical protein
VDCRHRVAGVSFQKERGFAWVAFTDKSRSRQFADSSRDPQRSAAVVMLPFGDVADGGAWLPLTPYQPPRRVVLPRPSR